MLEKVTLSNLYFKLHMHKQAHRLRPMMALFLTGMFFFFFCGSDCTLVYLH